MLWNHQRSCILGRKTKEARKPHRWHQLGLGLGLADGEETSLMMRHFGKGSVGFGMAGEHIHTRPALKCWPRLRKEMSWDTMLSLQPQALPHMLLSVWLLSVSARKGEGTRGLGKRAYTTLISWLDVRKRSWNLSRKVYIVNQ